MKATWWLAAVPPAAITLHFVQGPQESVCPDGMGSAEAIRAVRAQARFDGPLEAAVQPDIANDVVYLEKLQAETMSAVVIPSVKFYAVTPARYQIEHNRIVSETVEVDNYRKWLVAVSEEIGMAIVLEGSEDPVEQFNKLAKYLSVRVKVSEAAIDVFDFYLKVARGQGYRAHVLADSMMLEAVALEDFRSRLSANLREAAFKVWWKGVGADIKGKLRPPRAIAVKDGYDVQFFTYEQGKIWEKKILVASDGTIVDRDSKLIYAGGSHGN